MSLVQSSSAILVKLATDASISAKERKRAVAVVVVAVLGSVVGAIRRRSAVARSWGACVLENSATRVSIRISNFSIVATRKVERRSGTRGVAEGVGSLAATGLVVRHERLLCVGVVVSKRVPVLAGLVGVRHAARCAECGAWGRR